MKLLKSKFPVSAGLGLAIVLVWAVGTELFSGAPSRNPKPKKPKKITPASLDSLPQSATRYEVEVHVKSIIGSILITQELKRRALFKTEELVERSKELEIGCRVRLVGYIGLRSRRYTVFYIEDFERLETELEKLAGAVADLELRDGMGRIRLAEEALKKAAATRDAELESPANELLAQGIMLEEKKADKKNPDDLVRIALLYGEKLGEQNHAFRLLRNALELKPKHDGAIAAFKKLGAHFYRGRWITREEFMVAEGFVLEGDEWIRIEEKYFREAIRKRLAAHERDPIIAKRLRLLTEDTYARAVAEHRVLIGMSREDVANSLGFPEMVERRNAKGRIYDQWIYRDLYVYLENGSVFLKEKP